MEELTEYRVYVPGHRSTRVKAKTRLQALVTVLNRKGLRLADVKARAVEVACPVQPSL